MKIFFDTNIFLRFASEENLEQHTLVRQIFSSITEGKITPATSSFVLTEVAYTLRSVYHVPSAKIVSFLESILELRNLYLVDKLYFPDGFLRFRENGKKLADCLILAQLPPHYLLCTFDEELTLDAVRSISPQELVRKLGL